MELPFPSFFDDEKAHVSDSRRKPLGAVATSVPARSRAGTRAFGPRTGGPSHGRALLLRRVEVKPSDAFTRRIPGEMPVRMTVRLADGRTITGEKADDEGGHTRPLSWDQVRGKFDRLTAGRLAPPSAAAPRRRWAASTPSRCATSRRSWRACRRADRLAPPPPKL